MRRFILSLFAGTMFAVFCAGAALAIEYEYEDYTVKKGDTLWSISRRLMKSSYQWPLVWKENTRINNPDLIYVGQTIKIPVAVKRAEQGTLLPVGPAEPEPEAAPEPMPEAAPQPMVEVAPVTETESPIVAEPPSVENVLREDLDNLVNAQTILESGYITFDIPKVGLIKPMYQGRALFGEGDNMYIDTYGTTTLGDKFYVVRVEKEVDHPMTAIEMGSVVRIMGIVEAREGGTKSLKARVVSSFNDIEAGDSLDNFYEIEIPRLADEYRRPDVRGVVLDSRYLRFVNAKYDTIFLDKGSADGLMLGDELSTLMLGTNDIRNGIIQIIAVREHTALAVIKESEREILRGDFFVPYMD